MVATFSVLRELVRVAGKMMDSLPFALDVLCQISLAFDARLMLMALAIFVDKVCHSCARPVVFLMFPTSRAGALFLVTQRCPRRCG